jgi:hypothetical protein
MLKLPICGTLRSTWCLRNGNLLCDCFRVKEKRGLAVSSIRLFAVACTDFTVLGNMAPTPLFYCHFANNRLVVSNAIQQLLKPKYSIYETETYPQIDSNDIDHWVDNFSCRKHDFSEQEIQETFSSESFFKGTVTADPEVK